MPRRLQHVGRAEFSARTSARPITPLSSRTVGPSPPGGAVTGQGGLEILRVGVPHGGGNGPALESSDLDGGKEVLQTSVHALAKMDPLAFPGDVLGPEQERSQQIERDPPDQQDQGEQRTEHHAQPPVDPSREFRRRRPAVLDPSRHRGVPRSG